MAQSVENISRVSSFWMARRRRDGDEPTQLPDWASEPEHDPSRIIIKEIPGTRVSPAEAPAFMPLIREGETVQEPWPSKRR